MTEEMLVQHIYKELDYIWISDGSRLVKIGRLSELERLVRCFLHGKVYCDLLEDIGTLTDKILEEL